MKMTTTGLLQAAGLLLALVIPMSTLAADQVATCEMKITGSREVSVKGEAKPVSSSAPTEEIRLAKLVHAETDYWMNDKQLREMLRVSYSMGKFKGLPPAEMEKKIDEGMRKDPRLQVLFMSCGDKSASLNLFPTKPTQYAQVPFKPGKYSIEPQADKPGSFNAQLQIGSYPNADLFKAAEPGTLELTQFDARGLAGKFTFKAKKQFGGDEPVTVTGSFKYSCLGDACGR